MFKFTVHACKYLLSYLCIGGVFFGYYREAICTAEMVEGRRKLFVRNLRLKKCPNTKEIEKAVRTSMNNHGLIHHRKPDNIKKKMSNMIIKLKNSKNQ